MRQIADLELSNGADGTLHVSSLSPVPSSAHSAESARLQRAGSSAFDDVVHVRHHGWVQLDPEFTEDRHKHGSKGIEVGL